MNAAPVYPLPAQIGTPKSGLLQLRNGVADYFAQYSIPAEIARVGLKYRSFGLNQSNPGNANRVVFIPGVFDGSDSPKSRSYGELSRSSSGHSSVVNPRELLSWERPATISIWSAPVPGQSAAEDESINVVEDLLEQVVRAVQATAHADITWGSVDINTITQGAFGIELLAHITQKGPIFDVTLAYVQPTPGRLSP